MDATRLRALIDGALESQRLLQAARIAETAAREAVERAADRHRAEVGNLDAVLQGGTVIYGADLVRVGLTPSGGGKVLILSALATVPVVAPPPAPLPEFDPPVERQSVTAADMAASPVNKPDAPAKPAPPLSGGKTPPKR